MKKTLFYILALTLSLLLIPISAFAGNTISQLEKNKTIAVSITGNSINFTNVCIENKTSGAVTVEINPGTWFKSKSSSAQNMLVTSSRTVELAANETCTIKVPTACMNLRRNIPDESTRFSVGYNPSPKLTKLAKYLDENDCAYEVIQAAVWIITDKARDSTLLNSLVNQRGERVIQQSHIDEARRIIAELK